MGPCQRVGERRESESMCNAQLYNETRSDPFKKINNAWETMAIAYGVVWLTQATCQSHTLEINIVISYQEQDRYWIKLGGKGHMLPQTSDQM